MSDEFPGTDLLGEPMRELPDPRGRPKHRVTPENRSKVSVLRACGMSRDEIAEVIGVSKPTLEKYYFSELNEGVSRERAQAFLWLRSSAEGGNVSAQKAYISLLETGRGVPRVAEAAEDTPEKMGKKAVQQREAETAHRDSSWGELVRH